MLPVRTSAAPLLHRRASTGQSPRVRRRYRLVMEGFQQFMTMAMWIAIAGSPVAFIGVTFLHAARYPQWVWAFSDRTQVVWLASLLIGAAIVPIGLPIAVWYLIKVRPILRQIEHGDMAHFAGRPSS